MPAETHQLGCSVDAEGLLALLCMLLDDPPVDQTGIITFASLGVDAEGLSAPWEAVCEEFGERTLGLEIDWNVLEVSMTLEAASTAMAKLLGAGDDDVR
jgi:hypothetical protein